MMLKKKRMKGAAALLLHSCCVFGLFFAAELADAFFAGPRAVPSVKREPAGLRTSLPMMQMMRTAAPSSFVASIPTTTREGSSCCHNKRPAATFRTRLKAFPIDDLYIAEQSTQLNSAATSAMLASAAAVSSQWLSSAAASAISLDKDTAEAVAGPFFGFSLFPYLAFLYFLNVRENDCPKGVVVGFATCLLFVFLTIPAAIAAKLLYGVSLADCDWLHGSAESVLTITNLATVIPFRQALAAKERQIQQKHQQQKRSSSTDGDNVIAMPASATSYAPMAWLVAALTVVAGATALVPALSNPGVHTPYLNGFLDVPFHVGTHPEPENALTVATWIIHVSSLVEFLVAMGFCWRWADAVQNPRWKGLTWGLIPLHSSGITACVSHLFYNQVAFLVPFQALLTCVGNTTAAYAAYRIARSNGWQWPAFVPKVLLDVPPLVKGSGGDDDAAAVTKEESKSSLVGFEDLGDALANDNDYTFLIKLFAGCAIFSYLIKYGETFFDFPFEANSLLALAFIVVPSALNAYKWNRRSQDPTFEGWF